MLLQVHSSKTRGGRFDYGEGEAGFQTETRKGSLGIGGSRGFSDHNGRCISNRTRNCTVAGRLRRLILGEEEISDVSLATFQVFDRETPHLAKT